MEVEELLRRFAAGERDLVLLNSDMNHNIRPHPSPLPSGEGIRFLAPFSCGRRVGDEGNSSLHSATPP
jgi:hypothetical protein